MKYKLVIGSRGSKLALWQANHIKTELQNLYPDLELSIKVIVTQGDKNLDTPLPLIGGKGLFTKAVDEALLNGDVDLAVHSLKDLPTLEHKLLTIAAIPPRGNVSDALVSRQSGGINGLPQHAVVATGSLRRAAQLKHLRPDIRTVDIRGNVDTRLRKLKENDWHGLIIAKAGLERIGLQPKYTIEFKKSEMLPAAGQGALAVVCRRENDQLLQMLSSLNCLNTRLEVTAERAFLHALDGGCHVPVGAFAKVRDRLLELEGCIVSIDGSEMVRDILITQPLEIKPDSLDEATTLAEKAGRSLAETLKADGGVELLRLAESGRLE
ncbi:MAG: hydroxymethylbilane synthase [Calditrichota bacterium]